MNEAEIEQACDALLDRVWEQIASSGWNRFQLHGRGALLASVEMLKGNSVGMDYITSSPEAPQPEWLEAAIRDYDPKTAVVIVFVADDVFRSATRPAGPALAEEHTGILSGPAYVRIASRTPSPPECAKSLAN